MECRDNGYANTRDSGFFLDRAKPSYVGGFLAMAQASMREMTDLTRHLKARIPASPGTTPTDNLPWDGKDTHIIRPGSQYDLAALFAGLSCGRC